MIEQMIVIYWVIEWISDQMIVIEWVSEWLCDQRIECMSKQMTVIK